MSPLQLLVENKDKVGPKNMLGMEKKLISLEKAMSIIYVFISAAEREILQMQGWESTIKELDEGAFALMNRKLMAMTSRSSLSELARSPASRGMTLTWLILIPALWNLAWA